MPTFNLPAQSHDNCTISKRICYTRYLFLAARFSWLERRPPRLVLQWLPYYYHLHCQISCLLWCQPGPQDATQQTDSNKIDRMNIHKWRSFQGMTILRMGVLPLAWKSYQEKKVSRSFWASEIHSTDECCKLTQGLHNLVMEDLGLTKDV